MVNGAWKDVFCVVRGEFGVHRILSGWGVLHWAGGHVI
jgi:hypothetical protein